MTIDKTDFPGLLIIHPAVHEDSRGYFFESYNQKALTKEGILFNFVQDNQARSNYGTIRGLHYQLEPYGQTKLVRVLAGVILDVVVDIRLNSPGYGRTFAIELSAENKAQLLVPRGFAHGYSVLSDTAEVFYKCDAYYSRENEAGIVWNDPDLNIDWKVPVEKAVISEKDKKHPVFANCINNFIFKETEFR